MSDSQEQSWSDNPNAPKIPPLLYIWEKAYFAGALLGTILYGTREIPPSACLPVRPHSIRSTLGMVIVLFFKCMAALLNPARRKEGIKWGYVSYTAAMFSAVTVFVGMELNILSVSYIDNRRFAGVGGMLPPGPHGYELFIYSKALSIVPNLMFLLTNWLADGLLVSSFADAGFTRCVSNSNSSSSSIAATLSIQNASGSSLSPASCISPLSVRVWVPRRATAILTLSI